MKWLSLVAIGLAIALSVSAQTNTTDEKQQPAQEETGKANPENVDQGQGKQGFQARSSVQGDVNVNERKGGRGSEEANVRAKTHRDVRVQGRSGTASRSTTVFRKGRESSEHLSLHRGVRERTNVHFRIGNHPRHWWLTTYSIVLMDGCHYYLADDGCWYPAYGFDPNCDYPEGVVYCD